MKNIFNFKRYWAGKDSKFDTFLMVAAIAPVPIFEHFITRTAASITNSNKEKLSTKIRNEVIRLVSEELDHSHDHRTINKIMSEHGYPIDCINHNIEEYFLSFDDKKCQEKLALVVIMEFKIRQLSEDAPLSPLLFNEGVHFNTVKSFLLEHAKDELGHYNVSIDLYKELNIPRRILLKYLLKFSIGSFIGYIRILNRVLHSQNLGFKDTIYFWLHTTKRMFWGKQAIASSVIKSHIDLIRTVFLWK